MSDQPGMPDRFKTLSLKLQQGNSMALLYDPQGQPIGTVSRSLAPRIVQRYNHNEALADATRLAFEIWGALRNFLLEHPENLFLAENNQFIVAMDSAINNARALVEPAQ